MNPGIYGLGGQIVTPVQGPFSGTADARKLLSVQALIVAGGGGAIGNNSGRPGPGGGGGGVVDQIVGVRLGTRYAVQVGAGGTGGSSPTAGGVSLFASIVAVGGRFSDISGTTTLAGASGAGTSFTNRVLAQIPSQGSNGGLGVSNATSPGGGGGAGAVGADATASVAGSGGIGRASAITGTTIFYGAGGGGGSYVGTSTAGSGGETGGGNGSSATASAGTAGAANRGGGGGGGASNGTVSSAGGNGGSGVVVLRWNASQAVATLSAGLTFTRTTVGTDTVIQITAGTGEVTFN